MTLNEDSLIGKMRELLPYGEYTRVWSGDDCAEITTPGGQTLITTDVLVDGRHFKREWSAPSEIGRRAAAQNLADIAGQGGRTTALVTSLVIPKDFDIEWVLDVVGGFGRQVEPTGAGVVGGDLSSGNEFSISVTAIGYAPHGSVLRSGARPGDVIAIAGTLGHSIAGYELLNTGVVNPSLHSSEALGEWYDPVSTFRCPKPLLDAGVTAAECGATAMMDVSDGLSTDLTRMAKASKVVMELYPGELQEDVDQLQDAAEATGKDPWKWVLDGGEDHGMLACFPPDVVLPQPFRAIGAVGSLPQGHAPRARLDGKDLAPGGWDHFSRG